MNQKVIEEIDRGLSRYETRLRHPLTPNERAAMLSHVLAYIGLLQDGDGVKLFDDDQND